MSASTSRSDQELAQQLITLTEANARVLMALLKAQLLEFDGKKARSRF